MNKIRWTQFTESRQAVGSNVDYGVRIVFEQPESTFSGIASDGTEEPTLVQTFAPFFACCF